MKTVFHLCIFYKEPYKGNPIQIKTAHPCELLVQTYIGG